MIILLLILILLVAYGGVALTGMALQAVGAVAGVLLIIAVLLFRRRR